MAAGSSDRTSLANRASKAAVLGIGLAVSACLMGVALQARSGSLLAWFTLIPLFLSIRILTPLRASLAGAFWGLCLFLFSSLSADAPFAPSLSALALLTAAPGLYALVGSLITRRAGFSPLLLGLGWIGVELALQPLGIRHGLLAGTQGQGLIVRTMGYLSGYVVVAFLVAYVNASLLSMLSDVCVSHSGLRVAPRSTRSAPRLSPTELPAYLYQVFSPSQPRAPPV